VSSNNALFSKAGPGISLTPGKLKGRSREQLIKELVAGEAAEYDENERYVAAGAAKNKLPLCMALDGEKPCTGTAVRGREFCKEHDNDR
jgi:hypothetical protein